MKPHRQKQQENSFSGLFRGVLLGHLILLLHLVLLAGVGLLVIFFRGVVAYMHLILISGFIALAAMAYFLFRWLRTHGKCLGDILKSPAFSGKTVEIRLLGGVATLKLASQPEHPAGTVLEAYPPAIKNSVAVNRAELAGPGRDSQNGL